MNQRDYFFNQSINHFRKINDEIAQKIDSGKIPFSNYKNHERTFFFNSIIDKENQFVAYLESFNFNTGFEETDLFYSIIKNKLIDTVYPQYNPEISAKENLINFRKYSELFRKNLNSYIQKHRDLEFAFNTADFYENYLKTFT